MLPAALWPFPVRTPRERLGHGCAPVAAGCEGDGAALVGAGLLAGGLVGACVPLGEAVLGPGCGTSGVDEQAVTSAIRDTSAAAALARPAVGKGGIIGGPYICRWWLPER